jgi:hypothetical protein
MRKSWKMLAILACALLAANTTMAQDQGTAKTTAKKHKAAPHKTSGPTVSEQIQELKQLIEQQQQQINQLQQQATERDRAQQETQQAANRSLQQARDAASTADAANAAAVQAKESVDSVNSQVSDLKTNSTSLMSSIQEDQKKYNEASESPLSWHYKGMTITPGGFLEAATTWRQRAMASDVDTPFNSIPFTNADAGRLTEFYGTGRQSRLTFLAEGKLASVKIGGYYEMDWLGVGVSSNNNQSNSYVNRQRQLFAQVAFNSGWTITGGQMWSLVTETKKALDNRTEALPSGIDAQYAVGFSWARQYGLRVTKNINNKVWLGLSMENPQATFSNPSNSPNNFVIGNFGNNGGLYNGGGAAPAGAALATYAFSPMPDFVFKAAFEPGFGHYEIFGIVSQFRDRIYPNAPVNASGAFNDSRTIGGFGANARVTLAKKFDVGLHGLVGDGIGRYGSAGLPDATARPDGTLAPLHSYQGLLTLELHEKKWDIYGNGGGEYVARAIYLNGAGAQVGYGSTTNNNSGCGTEVLPGTGGFSPNNPSACTANTRAVFEGTFGFWFKPYIGTKGRVQFGPQYEYLVRNTWRGVGGDPNAINNVVMTSFRYYLP